MEPPLIGITAGNDPRIPGTYVLRWDYIRSVEAAGGVPMVLAPSGAALHSKLVERVEGLVLTGGVDIEPVLYGEKPHPMVTRISRERDEFELLLTRGALQRNVPVLAICRGLQMLNVVLGGTLIQDIPSMIGNEISHDHPDRPRHSFAHEVRLQHGTRLHSILGCNRIAVNSFHHQAARTLGSGLVPSAWADDGVIEAVEMEHRPFVLGVQWHPESFWNHNSPFGRLFQAFVNVARGW